MWGSETCQRHQYRHDVLFKGFLGVHGYLSSPRLNRGPCQAYWIHVHYGHVGSGTAPFPFPDSISTLGMGQCASNPPSARLPRTLLCESFAETHAYSARAHFLACGRFARQFLAQVDLGRYSENATKGPAGTRPPCTLIIGTRPVCELHGVGFGIRALLLADGESR